MIPLKDSAARTQLEAVIQRLSPRTGMQRCGSDWLDFGLFLLSQRGLPSA